MNVWQLLVRSRKFWIAVFGLVTNLVFYFLPEFPTEIWASVDAIVLALIGTIAAEDVAAKWHKG